MAHIDAHRDRHVVNQPDRVGCVTAGDEHSFRTSRCACARELEHLVVLSLVFPTTGVCVNDDRVNPLFDEEPRGRIASKRSEQVLAWNAAVDHRFARDRDAGHTAGNQ